MNVEKVTYFLYLALPLILILGSFMLFFSRVPPLAVFKDYRIARRALGFAFLFMGLFIGIQIVYGLGEHPGMLVVGLTRQIAGSFQAFLFTYSLVVLIDASYFTRKRILIQVIMISFFISLSLCAMFFGSESIKRGMLILYSVFYLFLIVYYTWIFMQRYNLYLKSAENFYADNEAERLQWVRQFFFTALFVAFISLLPVFFPKYRLDAYFSLFNSLFYLSFLVKYLNYPLDFYALTEVLLENEQEEVEIISTNMFEQKLNEWIEEQKYCIPGITISVVASELRCSAKGLSIYVNSKEHMNFNMWINTNRVRVAKHLLVEDREKPIAEIARETGFPNPSAFSKHFKMIEGVSPLNWRRNFN